MSAAVSTAANAIRDIQILAVRHRILNSIVGLVVIEEYLLSILKDIDYYYQITLTRDWDSGDIVNISVVPVPEPPPRHNRRGWWQRWTN